MESVEHPGPFTISCSFTKMLIWGHRNRGRTLSRQNSWERISSASPVPKRGHRAATQGHHRASELAAATGRGCFVTCPDSWRVGVQDTP